MVADRRADFVKECPHLEETMTNMYNFFLDRVRANLHVVLCFSPLSKKFSGQLYCCLLKQKVESGSRQRMVASWQKFVSVSSNTVRSLASYTP